MSEIWEKMGNPVPFERVIGPNRPIMENYENLEPIARSMNPTLWVPSKNLSFDLFRKCLCAKWQTEMNWACVSKTCVKVRLVCWGKMGRAISQVLASLVPCFHARSIVRMASRGLAFCLQERSLKRFYHILGQKTEVCWSLNNYILHI